MRALTRAPAAAAIVASAFWLLLPSQAAGPRAALASAFVTERGAQLFLDGKPFRFAGANIHYLGRLGWGTSCFTPATGSCVGRYPTHREIDSALRAAARMHLAVVRVMSMTSVGSVNSIEPTLNHFNSAAFEPLDYAIAEARKANIRFEFPLCSDAYFYTGGEHTFTDWEHLTNAHRKYSPSVIARLFTTNRQVIAAFEGYIVHVLDHVNRYTGVAYKNDPTIMAWETVNELEYGNPAWTETIARYVKGIAPNQLIVDGTEYQDSRNPQELHLPDVNIYTDHWYPVNLTMLRRDAAAVTHAGKNYFVGEYDASGVSGGRPLEEILTTIQATPAIAGDAFWQLYGPGMSGGDQYSIVYPGQTRKLRQRVEMLTSHALAMERGDASS